MNLNMIKLKRPQFVSKIFFLMLLSTVESNRPIFVLFRSVMQRSISRRLRVVALIAVFNKLSFGLMGRVLEYLYTKAKYPWLQVESKLIAYGTGAAVYLMRRGGEGKDQALRIYKKSIGKEYQGLLNVAQHYQANYKSVSSWYGGMLEVPPMEFLIMDNIPFLGAASVSLQPYIYGEKKGFFDDYSQAELLILLKNNLQVREQFTFFAQRTIDDWKGQKRIYDFVGDGNLVLLHREGGYRLCILDVGIFDLSQIVKSRPELLAKIENRMNELMHLFELVKKIDSHAS